MCHPTNCNEKIFILLFFFSLTAGRNSVQQWQSRAPSAAALYIHTESIIHVLKERLKASFKANLSSHGLRPSRRAACDECSSHARPLCPVFICMCPRCALSALPLFVATDKKAGRWFAEQMLLQQNQTTTKKKKHLFRRWLQHTTALFTHC